MVVGRKPTAELLDYDKVKLTLLKRFRYTTEASREKFLDVLPANRENRMQFVARLTGYFNRRVEMANSKQTFEDT